MVGLGIEFRCEAYNVLACDQLICGLEAHAEREVVEPLDHAYPHRHELAERNCIIASAHSAGASTGANSRPKMPMVVAKEQGVDRHDAANRIRMSDCPSKSKRPTEVV